MSEPTPFSLGTIGAMPPALTGSLALHAAAVAALAFAPEQWAWSLAAFAANHAVLAIAGMSPRSTLPGPNLSRLPPAARARGEVALTFDDGPDPVGTPRVLDILDRHHARASFFCVGTRASRDPGLIREIVARGHSVENHTFHHPHGFAFLGMGGLLTEIGETQAALTGIAGRTPAFFRAPMGFRGPLLAPVLTHFSLSLVSWTRRGLDGVPTDADLVVMRLTTGLAAGDVLVLHDGGPHGGRAAAGALPRLLETMAEQGLHGVSLPEAVRSQAVAPGLAGSGLLNPEALTVSPAGTTASPTRA